MRPAAYRIHTSAPVERAFMTRRSWQHPGRREFIHGRIHESDLVRRGRRIPSGRIGVAIAIAAASIFAVRLFTPPQAAPAPAVIGTSASPIGAGGARK